MILKTTKATVETEVIASDDGLNTYEVIKKLVGVDGESGYLISLYPTRNENNIFSNDNTLNHIVSHMQELGFNELHMINLFSKVVTSKISSRGLTVDEENMSYIESLMKNKAFKNSKFIIAWGNSMVSSQAVKLSKVKIFEMFKSNFPKSKVYQLTTIGRRLDSEVAPHPLYLGIRANNSVWGLQEFKITDKMLILDTVHNPQKSIKNHKK